MKKSVQWKIAQKFELGWWKYYLKNRPVEEYHHWKKNYWLTVTEKVRATTTLFTGSRVLDAGCGPAGIYLVLEDFIVDAIDPLLDQYDEKLVHFDKTDYPHVHFFNLALEEFHPAHTYDTIFCMNAINHVDDIYKSYDLLDSWLKPGGTLVMTIDAHNFNFFKHLFRIIPGDLMHPHQYSLEDYNEFLTRRHIRVEAVHLLKSEFIFNHYLLIAKKGS